MLIRSRKNAPTSGTTRNATGDAPCFCVTAVMFAMAVGVGSALLDAKAIADGEYGVLQSNAERIVANVRAAKEQL